MSDPDDHLEYAAPPSPTLRARTGPRSEPFDRAPRGCLSRRELGVRSPLRTTQPRCERFAAARGADDPDGLVNEVLCEVFTLAPPVQRRRERVPRLRLPRRPPTPHRRLPPTISSADHLGTPIPDQIGRRLHRTCNPMPSSDFRPTAPFHCSRSLTDDQRDVLLLRVDVRPQPGRNSHGPRQTHHCHQSAATTWHRHPQDEKFTTGRSPYEPLRRFLQRHG